MNRYIIVIPAKNRSFLLKCDEGDGAKLETLQKLVSGYVETVPAALDATWAREEADRLVLLVDEDGRLKCKAANQRATQLAPADVTENGKQPIVGAAVLMFQRGDELLGFTKHVADTICSVKPSSTRILGMALALSTRKPAWCTPRSARLQVWRNSFCTSEARCTL